MIGLFCALFCGVGPQNTNVRLKGVKNACYVLRRALLVWSGHGRSSGPRLWPHSRGLHEDQFHPGARLSPQWRGVVRKQRHERHFK